MHQELFDKKRKVTTPVGRLLCCLPCIGWGKSATIPPPRSRGSSLPAGVSSGEGVSGAGAPGGRAPQKWETRGRAAVQPQLVRGFRPCNFVLRRWGRVCSLEGAQRRPPKASTPPPPHSLGQGGTGSLRLQEAFPARRRLQQGPRRAREAIGPPASLPAFRPLRVSRPSGPLRSQVGTGRPRGRARGDEAWWLGSSGPTAPPAAGAARL